MDGLDGQDKIDNDAILENIKKTRKYLEQSLEQNGQATLIFPNGMRVIIPKKEEPTE